MDDERPQCRVQIGNWGGDCCCMFEAGHKREGEAVIHECYCGGKWYDDGSEVW